MGRSGSGPTAREDTRSCHDLSVQLYFIDLYDVYRAVGLRTALRYRLPYANLNLQYGY